MQGNMQPFSCMSSDCLSISKNIILAINPFDENRTPVHRFPEREGAQPVRGKGSAHPQLKPKERTFFQPD
jgi:hypothetical protein